MAGTTPIYGIPYPESSDLVANYPALGEDLAETLEDKLPTYAATAPTSPSVGQIWIDSGDDTPNFWDGSAWLPFPSGAAAAVFSNTATGTYTDGTGQDWNYYQFNSSGTLTCTSAGQADILVVSGGGGAGTSGGFIAGAGGGGAAYFTSVYLTAVAHTVTVGAGGAGGSQGGFSGIKATGFDGLRMAMFGGGAGGSSGAPGGAGSSGGGGSNSTGGGTYFSNAFGGDGTNYASGGAGGTATANSLAGQGAGITSDITGTAIVYGEGNYFPGVAPSPNTGKGGIQSAGAGGSGVIIIRTKV